jgi:PAS domain S-box-containing protein
VPDLIDLRGFGAEVDAIEGRLEALAQRVHDAGVPPEGVAREALAELQATLEALRISHEELTAQNDALAESRGFLEVEHDRYRALFFNAPVAYVVTDVRGVITQANRAAITLFNVDERFLMSKPLPTFVVPAHRAGMRQAMLSAAATGERIRGEWDVQPRRHPPLPAAVDVALLRGTPSADALLWLLQDMSTVEELRIRSGRLVEELKRPEAAKVLDDPAVRFALNELAGLLLADLSLEDVAKRVTDVGRQIIPGAAGVSVSLFEQGRPRVGGVSAPWVLAVDEAQYELQDGPCVAALADGDWHVVEDLDEDTRWPRFAAQAVEQGVLSVLAVPLLVRGARLGVLNVYATARESLSGDALTVARRLAEICAVLLANAQTLDASRRLSTELQQALVSRATVDMAKGVLMARLDLDPDTAFEALRDLSQRRHMKLRDLAAEIVAAPAR